MLVQFLPQILAYLALAWWAWHNTHPLARLGLTRDRLWLCLSWGVGTGLVLGALNTAVMLWIVPWLGGDLEFLRDIPHARVPTPLMWPWTIVVIAALVELNFRGFLLGRLLTLSQQMWRPPVSWLGPAVAIGLAAGIFAFDPFLVATFRHLHWIGVWDAVIWGLLWVRFRNLAVPVVAHAMEVSLEYAVMKWTLTGEI
ncbi:MAG: CPBP family glutamic-type intramembrane protease [Nitrospirales bacterium]